MMGTRGRVNYKYLVTVAWSTVLFVTFEPREVRLSYGYVGFLRSFLDTERLFFFFGFLYHNRKNVSCWISFK